MDTTVLASRVTMPAPARRVAVSHPVVDRTVLPCACGQALDVRTSDHCPRCGVTLGERCRPGGAA